MELAVNRGVVLDPYKVNMGISIGKELYEWSYEIGCVQEEELILTNEKSIVLCMNNCCAMENWYFCGIAQRYKK